MDGTQFYDYDGLQPKITPPKHFSLQCIYLPSPLPVLQAKFIEKNKDTRKDRKIADLRIYIVLFTLQKLFSECSHL